MNSELVATIRHVNTSNKYLLVCVVSTVETWAASVNRTQLVRRAGCGLLKRQSFLKLHGPMVSTIRSNLLYLRLKYLITREVL